MMNPMPAPARTQTLVTVVTCRDAATVFDVLQAAAHVTLPAGLSDPTEVSEAMRGGMAFFVAHIGRTGGESRPVGAIGYRWERGTLRITHVAVKGEARSTGVARRLVQAVEAIGQALGSTNVSAEISHEDDHISLFEHFGYSPVGEGASRPMTKRLAG